MLGQHDKKARGGSGAASTAHSVAEASASSSPPIRAPAVDLSMVTMPTVVLSHIASFARGGHLSGACRSTLEAIPGLHYKISIKDRGGSFSAAEDPTGALSTEHMGLQPSGALATGRVVTHATVTGCTDYKTTNVSRALLVPVDVALTLLSVPPRALIQLGQMSSAVVPEPVKGAVVAVVAHSTMSGCSHPTTLRRKLAYKAKT